MTGREYNVLLLTGKEEALNESIPNRRSALQVPVLNCPLFTYVHY
jgi:hypothetical protein